MGELDPQASSPDWQPSTTADRVPRRLAFKRTESGYDKDFDRVVRSKVARAAAGLDQPNPSVFDPTWARVVARHSDLVQSCQAKL